VTNVFTPPTGPTVLPGGQVVQHESRNVLPQAGVSGAVIERDAGSVGQGQVVELEDAVIRVRNVGSGPFRARYLTNWVTIAPGTEAVLPWEMFVHFFGDPRLANHGPNRRDREDAYKRIRFKYGSLDNDELWAENRPRVECWRMNGDPIVPLCDDPEGANVHEATMTIAGQAALESQIAYLQQQVATLQMQANAPQVTPDHRIGPAPAPHPAVSPDDEASEDTPRNRAPRKRS
jgi:hypothetical protein